MKLEIKPNQKESKIIFGIGMMIMCITSFIGISELLQGTHFISNIDTDVLLSSGIWFMIGLVLVLFTYEFVIKSGSDDVLKTIFLIAVFFTLFLVGDNVLKITSTQWEYLKSTDDSVLMGSVEGYSIMSGLYDYLRYGEFIRGYLLNPYFSIASMSNETFDGMIEIWYWQLAFLGVFELVLILGYRAISVFLSNPNHPSFKFQNPVKLSRHSNNLKAEK